MNFASPSIPTENAVTPASDLGGPAERLSAVLRPVFEAAAASSSLIGSQHVTRLAGQPLMIPKFLLLGQRGGGRPIRLAILAGLEQSGYLETASALARVLLRLRANPGQARDYALFAYPAVDGSVVSAAAGTVIEPLAKRLAERRLDGDVLYLQSEVQKWTFDGLLTLREEAGADGFSVAVRSEVIGQEVARPALAALAKSLPLAAESVAVRDAASGLVFTGGKGLSRNQPAPFEVELIAPGKLGAEARVAGLVTLSLEVLRHYRRLISHAADL